MTPYEIISQKRDGKPLSDTEIDFFISSFMSGKITDYQMTALLMAIYIRDMDSRETSALTRAYIRSGETIDLSAVSGRKIDKHSTGGVGDKVSIILAPLVASLGVAVPMISGRGLGHSGGTLDKLESIPGFRTDLPVAQFRQLVQQHRLGLIGQTRDIVPADKRIYALRDVTATVDCIPLISASIMSKKIAEGIDGLVLDVKYGNGAFMKDTAQAEQLAHSLIAIGREFGEEVVALLTSMEQPLGNAIGNWLEIRECLDCFQGKGPEDLMEVTLALAGEMLQLGGAADSAEDARRQCQEALHSGRAFDKFLDICRAQGADTAWLRDPAQVPPAAERRTLAAGRSGYLSRMDTFAIGMASVQLGAGRLRAEDDVDPLAGIVLHKKLGDPLQAGEALLEIHTRRADTCDPVLKRLESAITIADAPPEIPPLILKKMSS